MDRRSSFGPAQGLPGGCSRDGHRVSLSFLLLRLELFEFEEGEVVGGVCGR